MIGRVRQQTASAESTPALLKRYGDALRGALSRMPNDPADIPAFFRQCRTCQQRHRFICQ